MPSTADRSVDALVIGGGLAGLASAIHLSRAGLSVLSLEQRASFDSMVGESLDWSAPDLLAELGLPKSSLLASECATLKRHVAITSYEGAKAEYLPGAWLANAPWNVELDTLHLDRLRIHEQLMRLATAAGAQLMCDKVVDLHHRDQHIEAVETARGMRIRPHWVIDATGADAHLLARTFSLRFKTYGPRKVAIWAHLPAADNSEGTTLYMMNPAPRYMAWLWEIPITPRIASVGYVAPGSDVKEQRSSGKSNAEILSAHLSRIPKWQRTLETSPMRRVFATSFECRTLTTASGRNWIIVGEAASQSDPITGNGVTAALRHAREGSELILRHAHRRRLPVLARFTFNLRVLAMGRFFNGLIERLFYEPPVRARFGVFRVTRAYTVPAWLANLAYSRSRPRRLLGTLAFCSILAGLRAACWVVYAAGRLSGRLKPTTTKSLIAARGEHALCPRG